VVVSRDESAMKKHAGSFDFILSTVAVSHNLDAYTELLRVNGTLCLVGAPATPHQSPSVWNLMLRRRSIAGSAIGGIGETQEMLNFCAKKGIASDVEVIPIQKINEAYERMLRNDVKYRFVIDMASLT
jgi:alcohol dehydrogenase (NADP+)